MNLQSVAVLALIAVISVCVLFYIIKNRKKLFDCSNCNGDCSQCKKKIKQ